MAKKCKVSLFGDENALKLTVGMDVQPCECHWNGLL